MMKKQSQRLKIIAVLKKWPLLSVVHLASTKMKSITSHYNLVVGILNITLIIQITCCLSSCHMLAYSISFINFLIVCGVFNKKKTKLSLSVTVSNNHTRLQMMCWGAPSPRFLAYVARTSLLRFPDTQKIPREGKINTKCYATAPERTLESTMSDPKPRCSHKRHTKPFYSEVRIKTPLWLHKIKWAIMFRRGNDCSGLHAGIYQSVTQLSREHRWSKQWRTQSYPAQYQRVSSLARYTVSLVQSYLPGDLHNYKPQWIKLFFHSETSKEEQARQHLSASCEPFLPYSRSRYILGLTLKHGLPTSLWNSLGYQRQPHSRSRATAEDQVGNLGSFQKRPLVARELSHSSPLWEFGYHIDT